MENAKKKDTRPAPSAYYSNDLAITISRRLIRSCTVDESGDRSPRPVIARAHARKSPGRAYATARRPWATCVCSLRSRSAFARLTLSAQEPHVALTIAQRFLCSYRRLRAQLADLANCRFVDATVASAARWCRVPSISRSRSRCLGQRKSGPPKFHARTASRRPFRFIRVFVSACLAQTNLTSKRSFAASVRK